MPHAENKTTENDGNVLDFLNAVENPQKRKEAKIILQLIERATQEPAKMWGNAIVGFGNYHYKYKSGREGDFMKVGFSPRKQNLTLYIMPGFDRMPDLLDRLGKYRIGKSCLYIKKIADVDMEVLEELVKYSYDYMTKKYG